LCIDKCVFIFEITVKLQSNSCKKVLLVVGKKQKNHNYKEKRFYKILFNKQKNLFIISVYINISNNNNFREVVENMFKIV